jgi:excinuclease ABC subunit C
MDRLQLIDKIKKFPDTPGVYVMRGSHRNILYIGKATSLRHRVLSYFQRPQEARIETMLSQVENIEIQRTDSVVEALLLESNLIKKFEPKYNIKLKDGKTYLGIFVTKEDWPRVLPARLTEKLPAGEFFGPFPSSKEVGDALQILRKLFPFRVSCIPESGKACFEYHMGMCPGVCFGKITKDDYKETIKQLKLFLRGQKKEAIRLLQHEMRIKAKNMEFEKAARLRDQIFALKHIQDVALIRDEDLDGLKPLPARIEAYDISNISGTFNVGSMVVFTEGIIDKSQYRKFKIKTVSGADDTSSLKEVLVRRLKHNEWKLPEIILVDGGRGQVNAMNEILTEQKIDIPVIGIAKGPKRDRNDVITPEGVEIDKKLLVKIRDEAHRFAIEYYRKLHQKSLVKTSK